jgi:tRNA(His) guanylyltransferase|tara:strand:- start:20811 stop:21641 length:831 start_codon:yes stop_codon:yes gene_type:complete
MKDVLGNRIKDSFENRAKTKLIRKCPVIIRLDGKSFGKFTKGFKRPFDDSFIDMMDKAALYLCKEIQGAKMAYVQSDEISILLTDFDTPETQAWFDYSVQKMTSVSSSFATSAFNKNLLKYYLDTNGSEETIMSIEREDLKFANFDSRVFSVSREEDVIDYFVWRMKDAEKNSISMLAQSMFSHKTLDGVSGRDKIEMCQDKGVDWNEMPSGQRFGRIISKQTEWRETEYPIKEAKFKDGSAKCEGGKNFVMRSKWKISKETIPFWHERDCITKHL